MKLLCLSVVTLLSCSIYDASAFMVQDPTPLDKSNAANLGDPDDKIPYPHVADDGTASSNNLTAQPIGNGGVSFSVSPSDSAPTDAAFQRAQERMQQ